MAKAKSKNKSKRPMSRKMKRNMRWTIAGLFMVTAIVIALIPVQNGGVSALTSDTDLYAIPNVEKILDKHYFVSGTSVPKQTSGLTYAYPYARVEPDGPFTPPGASSSNYPYYIIDTTGMGNNPCPLYEIANSSSGVQINRYIGETHEGYVEPITDLKLSDRIIISRDVSVANKYFVKEDGSYVLVKGQIVGDSEVINNNKEGEFTVYEEEPVTNNGYTCLYVKVKKYTVTKEGEEPSVIYKVSEPVEGESFYACKKGTSSQNVDVPIVAVADDAFSNLSYVTNITLPNTITKIGDNAFRNCGGLSSVTIGALCESIGDCAFENCSSLSNVNIDAGGKLSKIGDCAFANCSSLNTIDIPVTGTASIGSGAFFNCNNLRSFTTNSSATISMGCNVFTNCISLEEIQLDGVKSIQASHNVPDPDEDGKLAACGIFHNCAELKRVTFGEKFDTKVPANTFVGDSQLEYIKFLNGSATMENGDFDNIRDGKFYIWGPSGSVNTHKYAANNGITYRYGVIAPNDTTYELIRDGYKYEFTATSDTTATINKISKADPSLYDSSVVDITKLNIPYNIGGYDIKEIADNACLDDSGKGLSDPVNITIPDSIDRLGNSAFANMPKLETVELKHYRDGANNDIPASSNMSIGDLCFSGNKNLTDISIRTYDDFLGEVYDPVITYLGDGAFATGNPSKTLTIHGKMEQGYLPYEYSIDPSKAKINNLLDGYIIYESREPELLKCQYKEAHKESGKDMPEGVYLLEYPTGSTECKDIEGSPKVSDIIAKTMNVPPETITSLENKVIENFEHIEIPAGITIIESANNGNMFRNLEPVNVDGYTTGTKSIIFNSLTEIPDKAFASTIQTAGDKLNDIHNNPPSTLETVEFRSDITKMGETPFHSSENVTNVIFSTAEGNGTPENPTYSCINGIIYSDSGSNEIAIEECLPSRGISSGSSTVDDISTNITSIKPHAFENCDGIVTVDLSQCNKLEEIPPYCFHDADSLMQVNLSDETDIIGAYAFSVEEGNNTATERTVAVVVPDVEVHIDADAFKYDKRARLYSYPDSAAAKYAKEHSNEVEFFELSKRVKLTYLDNDGTIIKEIYIDPEKQRPSDSDVKPDDPKPKSSNYVFSGWQPTLDIKPAVDTIFVAQYTLKSSTNTSGSSTTTSSSSSGSGSGSGSGTTTSSSKSTSSSSTAKSSTGSSSGSSTRNTPVVVSGAPAPYSGVGLSSATAPAGSATTGGGNNVQTGNTNAVSTAGGLDSSKLSATVNGSSDNYVIKITETTEADELAKQALTGEFGSLDNIRYYPFDVSLYDSSGTQKISPVPDGVTVSVTMPIPDDLTIYGGNNKIGSTVGGTLEKIQPKFTVIDGVPCMNFTVSHLSPYVVYVDTANLTAGGVQDATPKTADPIHPKWFLVIGFAAISIFLFLKRDKQSMPANVA